MNNEILSSPNQRKTLFMGAAALILSYLTVYLFIQYITDLAPVTLHTLVLIPGVVLGSLIAFRQYLSSGWSRPSFDWLLIAVLFSVFILSAVINKDAYVWLDIRAYVLSLLSFFFVRATGAYLPIGWLYRLSVFFLITSGILALCQVYLGAGFYVATYLGGGISTIYATGFATMTSLAGVMMLWPLGILISKLASEPTHSSGWWEWMAVVLGSVGLFSTLSRAAIGGLALVLIVLFAARAWQRRPIKRALLITGVVITSMVIAYAIPSRLGGYIDSKILGELDIPSRLDGYININSKISGELESMKPIPKLNASIKKLTAKIKPAIACEAYVPSTNNYSLNTRFLTALASRQVMEEHPLWGAGVGRFSDYYQACFELLPQRAQKRVDPRSRMTTHNAYLEGATDLGLLFLVSLLVLVVWTGWQSWKCGSDHVSFHLFIGLLGVMAWMGTHDFLKDRLFWIALALPLAYLSATKNSVNLTKPNRSCPPS